MRNKVPDFRKTEKGYECSDLGITIDYEFYIMNTVWRLGYKSYRINGGKAIRCATANNEYYLASDFSTATVDDYK